MEMTVFDIQYRSAKGKQDKVPFSPKLLLYLIDWLIIFLISNYDHVDNICN